VGKGKPQFDSDSGERKHTEKKLSPLKLKTLEPGRDADGGGGLYLLVQDSGSRSWILRTTIKGKRKEIGLGGLSSRTLAQVREVAAELLEAKKGEDILEQRRLEKRVIPTFEHAAATVHANLRLRKLCVQKHGAANRLLYLDHLERNGSGLFAKARELDLEGIVAKWKSGQYVATDRRSSWVKIKNRNYSQLEGREELFERA
jgi:Arm DNA-binding domain